MSLRPRSPLGRRRPTPVGARRTRLDNVLAAGLTAGLAARLRPSASTGEFYALSTDEAEKYEKQGEVELFTQDDFPPLALRENQNATFRLPFPESAPKDADGNYKYRVYDAALLWGWVSRPGRAFDPLDRTPLLKRDWEELRDRYSSATAHPTPPDTTFRNPITTGLWPPGVPYSSPPLPPLTNATIADAVEEALRGARDGHPVYRHSKYGPIADWDVSNVTDMSRLFRNRKFFNGNLRRWDVRNVTDMSGMFESAYAFNGDLSRWDVRNVTNMSRIFYFSGDFNGDLSRWDVRNVTSMDFMFYFAYAFKGDLSRWDVRNVTNMSRMFASAYDFNGDLSRWDVRNVTDMRDMFKSAEAFNGDLRRWDVSNVTNMRDMFAYAYAFNGDLSRWDVRNVTDMRDMFAHTRAFNGDLSRWDVRNVTDMRGMFQLSDAYQPAYPLGSRAAWRTEWGRPQMERRWTPELVPDLYGGPDPTLAHAEGYPSLDGGGIACSHRV
jgi:surface protein